MVRQFSFAASSSLAVIGTLFAIAGIFGEDVKTIAVGIVLIFAAGVFATLYLGSRNLA